jgi:hypothetical protein
MSLDQLPGPPGVDDPCKPIDGQTQSSVQGLLCAILCSMACGCGGGGGDSGGGIVCPTNEHIGYGNPLCVMGWLDQFYSARKTHGSGANGATPLRELARRDIAIEVIQPS